MYVKKAKVCYGRFAFIAFLTERIEGFGLKGRFWPESTGVVVDADAQRSAADFDWIIYVSLRGRGTSQTGSTLVGASQTPLVCFGKKASANIASAESNGEPFTYFLYLVTLRAIWKEFCIEVAENRSANSVVNMMTVQHRCTTLPRYYIKKFVDVFNLYMKFLHLFAKIM